MSVNNLTDILWRHWLHRNEVGGETAGFPSAYIMGNMHITLQEWLDNIREVQCRLGFVENGLTYEELLKSVVWMSKATFGKVTEL